MRWPTGFAARGHEPAFFIESENEGGCNVWEWRAKN
jgi:hypothetical protein